MYKTLSVILLVVVGISNVACSFNTPSKNLQHFPSDIRGNNVGIDLCPTCVPFIGTVCDLACDAVGIDEFIHLIIAVDIDPIWYCEMARLCPINDHGDAKFIKFGVLPNTGPQGTTFMIDCSFKSMNGTGTSMLRLEITDPHNETESNDYLIESKKPGMYTEKIGLRTLTALNCDSTKGLCDAFPVGTYNVTVQLCNGECGSHHPHSQTYDVGKASFTVTKKK